MHMFDWDDLKHFLEVVRAGSVSGAGTALGVNYTTVSRRITALEQSLGVSLFDRSGGDWALTAAGETILGTAESMADFASIVQRSAIRDSEEVSGVLRVTAVDMMIERMLMPDIRDFKDLYPAIELELISTDDPLSLSAREADVAIRGTNNPPPNVLGKKLCHMVYQVYGTEEFLDKYKAGEPVPTITWLGDGRTRPDWINRNFPDTPSVTRVNTIELNLEAALMGFGVSQLPAVVGDPQPSLHRLPVSFVEEGTDFWILSHTDLKKTARVRLFRDFMIERLDQRKDLFEGRMPDIAAANATDA